MITLSRLQGMGAISGNLKVIDLDGVRMTNFTNVKRMSEDEQQQLKGIVTVDNPQWLATTKGRAASEAKTVYSCNSDGEIGCWKSERRTFNIMELSNSQLQTIELFKLSEKKVEVNSMANLGLTEEMANFGADIDSQIDTNSLKTEAAVAQEVEDGKKEKSKRERDTEAVLGAIRSIGSGKQIADFGPQQLHNHKLGRLLFFITPSDDAIKASKRQRVRTDANGNKIVDPDKVSENQLTETQKAEYEKKGYPKKYCKTEPYVAFANGKPGKPVAIAVTIPASSEVSLTNIYSNNDIAPSSFTDDMVVRIMSMENAYPWLAANFANYIKEDERVLGNRASKVDIKYVPSQTEDESGKTHQIIRRSLVLNKEEAKRNTLLTTGNFFPLKVYATESATNITAEVAKVFNLHFKAMFKKSGDYEALCKESKDKIHFDVATGDVTSTYFDEGEQIKVKKFDGVDDNDIVADVRIPLREERISKEGKKTYPFVYHKLGEEGGPQTIKEYQDLVEFTGMSMDDFVETAIKFTKRASSAKKRVTSISANDFLLALGTQIDTGATKSLAQLQEEIAGL